ncbi:MAG: GNAT family N-acetyltransferase [Halobacteriovoraceae bacterium]|jgi:ribosomal protein S18 acetylase RimI-like enzyme|nr:GNAT family N-acetyltransferase [Halobacteriovoraceae bacterium]
MKEEIVIRNLIEFDEIILAEMYCRLNTDTFIWMAPGTFSNEDFERDTSGEEILVAVLGDQLVGFVSVKHSESLIHHLYIDSKTQGKGIGKVLLDSGVELINKRPVFLNCRVKNERALNFYKKYGFEIDGKADDPPDDYYKMRLY